MKDKILYLILGILIGAVITAGCFLVFSRTRGTQMRGERPDFSNMSEEERNQFQQRRPNGPAGNTINEPTFDQTTTK